MKAHSAATTVALAVLVSALTATALQPHARPLRSAGVRPLCPRWVLAATDNKNEEAATGKGEAADDVTSSPAFLKKKLESMQKQLEKIEAETAVAEEEAAAQLEEWGPEIDKLKNDYKALQDRAGLETMAMETNARVKLIKDVLPILDNADVAKKAIGQGGAGEQIAQHYDDIFVELRELLESKLGLEAIATVGEPFDVNLHAAVQQIPSEYDADVVCMELQKGYKIGDQLIRPAMVAVSIGQF